MGWVTMDRWVRIEVTDDGRFLARVPDSGAVPFASLDDLLDAVRAWAETEHGGLTAAGEEPAA